jgi:O-antigen/teichoic acid export membrane protein
VLSFCWGGPGSLFLALGKTKRNLLLSAVMLAVPVAAHLVGRPTTVVGVAVCWASGIIVLAPWLIWLVLHELERSPLWLLGRIAPALIATAAMAAPVMLLQRTLARDLSPVAHLAASAAVGVCVFSGVAWLALGRRPAPPCGPHSPGKYPRHRAPRGRRRAGPLSGPAAPQNRFSNRSM